MSFLTSLIKASAYQSSGDINTASFVNKTQKELIFVTGWPYWDVNNFIKYSHELRAIFKPAQKYFGRVQAFLSSIDESYSKHVAVHMRLGDYKEYLNGRFYYSPEVYWQKITEVYEQLLEMGEKPIFIICSNEKIATTDWKVDFPFRFSGLDGISDLILLSKCDLIFGPPSTFSMWASFYGQVPSTVILSKNEPLMLEEFSPIVAPSTYANGRVLVDIYEKYSV